MTNPIIYRPPVGGYTESMILCKTFLNKEEMLKELKTAYLPFILEDITCEYVTKDIRNGWDTYYLLGKFHNNESLKIIGYTNNSF